MKFFLNTKDEKFVENSFVVSVLQAELDSDSDFDVRFDLGSTRFLDDDNKKKEIPSTKTIIQYVAITMIALIIVISVIAAFINSNIKETIMIRMSAKSFEFETQTTELNDGGIQFLYVFYECTSSFLLKPRKMSQNNIFQIIFVLDYERNKSDSFQEYQFTPTADALNRKESLIRFEEAKNDLITNFVGN